MATRAIAAVVPDYWDDACRHLGRRDRVMRKLIPKFGEARLQSRGDAFTTLARSIVGQQISVKAAQSVWGVRFTNIELPPFFQFNRIGPPTSRHMFISPFGRSLRRRNNRPLSPTFSSACHHEKAHSQHDRQLRNFHLRHNLHRPLISQSHR
ncbi:MAG TPA: hypothetical protein VLL94_07610 [Nitrospiraceae bacterium]|nr:hypothetical protein [Nitrospiraceae bacterium]